MPQRDTAVAMITKPSNEFDRKRFKMEAQKTCMLHVQNVCCSINFNMVMFT